MISSKWYVKMTDTNNRSARATKQNLEIALQAIDDIAKSNEISSDARARATKFYQQTLEEHSILYGWGIETAACACLYLACKVEHEGISPGDLASGSENVDKKIVLRRAKQLRRELGLEFLDIVDPFQYVEPYINDLGASEEIQDRTEEILNIIADTQLVSGKSPRAVAAAAIYNASIDESQKIIQKEISKVADVTEVTIRNRYQEQREYLDDL